MSEAITPEVSDRICKHMNQDHADAVLTYVHKFGNETDATSATMVKIDERGMDLTAEKLGETIPVRVNFDHSLVDAKDAHTTLVAMLK
ncbi:MAG: DUF2470 domain-containing protein [Synechococcaceae cyanobacterium RL_1_2]|nr:DUF2470 domain-containing protein [Synechococcaceae cyanobacterium RL_1_2]